MQAVSIGRLTLERGLPSKPITPALPVVKPTAKSPAPPPVVLEIIKAPVFEPVKEVAKPLPTFEPVVIEPVKEVARPLPTFEPVVIEPVKEVARPLPTVGLGMIEPVKEAKPEKMNLIEAQNALFALAEDKTLTKEQKATAAENLGFHNVKDNPLGTFGTVAIPAAQTIAKVAAPILSSVIDLKRDTKSNIVPTSNNMIDWGGIVSGVFDKAIGALGGNGNQSATAPTTSSKGTSVTTWIIIGGVVILLFGKKLFRLFK